MDPLFACTIVSNNYLPYARVFAQSFVEHHREGRVWVLVVDEPDPSVDYGSEPFEVLFAADLGIRRLRNMAFRYSVLELNTALKPCFLAELHRREGCGALCYFDPDILVTGDLRPVYEILADRDLILTPHVLEGVEDEKYPSEREFLLSGIFNLGFLGVAFRPASLAFLDWWRRRLAQACFSRVEEGLFVDQKWMDFAPAFLDRVEILRDPGYNVAYWNLMHREVRATGEGYLAADRPLRFFHFSGLEPDDVESVSKFQDRFSLADLPALRPLFQEYRSRLLRAGYEEAKTRPYAFGAFSNGVLIPPIARELLRRLDSDGSGWPEPFDAESKGSYFEWLNQPLATRSGIRLPRLALALWDQRPDAQALFPSPLGRDEVEFARWFVREVELSPVLDGRFAVPTSLCLRDLAERADERAAGREDETPDGEDEAWLVSEPDAGLGRRPRLTRQALGLHRQRADLRAQFPDPLGGSRERFALWFVTYGRLEYRLSPRFVAPVARSLSLRRRAFAAVWWWRRRARGLLTRGTPDGGGAERLVEEPRPVAAPLKRSEPEADRGGGIVVVGWTRSATGVGEVARGTLEALAACSIPSSVVPLAHPGLDLHRRMVDPGSLRIDPGHRVVLFHVNADMMGPVCRALPTVPLTGAYRIGYWFWELSFFPLDLAGAFELVDEVWAPSEFCRDAFSSLAPCPVRWVPPAVRRLSPGRVARADLGVPEDAFVFCFLFDALSVPARKNPLGLLRAFERVVGEAERPVHLLLKISHAESDRHLLDDLRRAARHLPVTIVDRTLRREALHALLSSADAFVSLHRAEGLGLPMIESMSLGKPVIATAYGGCTDFLDEVTGWPVRYRLERLSAAHGPYPAGSVWAAPDLEHAAERMLEVLRQPAARARKTGLARRRIEDLFSPEAAGERIREELERITGEGRVPEPSEVADGSGNDSSEE